MKTAPSKLRLACSVVLLTLLFLSEAAGAAGFQQPYGVVEDLAWDSPSEVQPLITAMAAAGVQTVRMDFRWYMIEPSKGQFVFGVHDPIVAALRAQGIEILGIFDDVPTFPNGQSGPWSGTYPPNNDADWADYISRVAEHYKDQVRYWELWNEENIAQFFRPQPDAARYVRLLKAGYEAVRAANPGARVVLGGLAGNGVNMGWELEESRYFLQKIYDNGGKGYFDIVAIHPYVHPIVVGWGKLYGFVRDTRNVMAANGEGDKPIWLGEIGWSTAPNAWNQPTVSESEMANWVQTVYGRQADLGVEKIFWYNFRDSGTDPLDVEHHFGLVRRDLTPKPAYLRYRDATRRPTCHVTLNKTDFVTGDSIIVQSVAVTNPKTTAIPIEYKLWIDLPGGGPYVWMRGGADDSVSLAAGASIPNALGGPVTLAIVSSTFPPRGGYALECRFVDPVIGKDLVLELTAFTVQ